MEPRHPPNALNSLTTETWCISPSSTPNPFRSSVSPFEPLRQMAKSSRTSNNVFRRQVVRVVRLLFHWPSFSGNEQPAGVIPIKTLVLRVARSIHSDSCFTLRSTIQFSGPAASWFVGQERLELSTPRLSSVCSNQLSYWPMSPQRGAPIGLSRPNSKLCLQSTDNACASSRAVFDRVGLHRGQA